MFFKAPHEMSITVKHEVAVGIKAKTRSLAKDNRSVMDIVDLNVTMDQSCMQPLRTILNPVCTGERN